MRIISFNRTTSRNISLIKMSQNGKRTIHDTSIEENNDSKRANASGGDDSDTQRWARCLIERVDTALVEMKVLASRVSAVEETVEVNSVRIEELTEKVESLEVENKELKGTVTDLRNDFDEQVDRSLRDHINFYGVKASVNERTWEDTTKILADWLSEKLGKEPGYYNQAIERCHRGAHNPAKFGLPHIL